MSVELDMQSFSRFWNESITLFVTIIHTQGIQMTTRKKLCAIKGISEAKVDKIKVSSKPSLYAHCITSLLTCYTQEAAGKLIVSENYFKPFNIALVVIYSKLVS